MSTRSRGIEIPFGKLPVGDLNDLSKKAGEILEQVKRPDRQRGSPYRELAIAKAEEYLWLIIQSIDIELRRRDWAQKYDRVYWNLCMLGTVFCPGEKDTIQTRSKMWREVKSYASEVQRHSRAIDRIGSALAALSAVDTNDFLTEIGLPQGSSLRPIRNEEVVFPIKRESKPQAFRSFAAQWWNEQRPRAGKWRASDEDLADFAAQCDAKKFKPNSAFLPTSVCSPIEKYNRKHTDIPIRTFKQLVMAFGKGSSAGQLRPLKAWLSANAKNAAKRPDRKG